MIKNFSVTFLTFLTLLSIFFLVPIKILGFGVRVDDVLILTCVPLAILYLRKVRTNRYLLPICLFLFSPIFSLLYGYSFLNVPFSFGDINEYIRYVKILLFAVLLGYNDINTLKNMTFKMLYFGSFYIIFVGYMQYFDPVMGIGKHLSLFYTSESQIYVATEHIQRRISVTGSGPNDGAIQVSYFLLFNFFSYMFLKKKKYGILFFLLFPILFFASSRTVLIGAVVVLAFSFLVLKGVGLRKFFICFAIISFVASLYARFSYVSIGVDLMMTGENNSLLVRLDNALEAYRLFLDSPVFGWGFTKWKNEITMDSEYLSLISRFGVVGLIAGLFLIIYPMQYKRTVDKLHKSELNIFYYTAFSSCVIGLFVMFTNNFITGYQSFLPFVLLTVLSFRLIQFYEHKQCTY